jgi:signal transduction histidine kinase/integral membrane sensor domain MASE1
VLLVAVQAHLRGTPTLWGDGWLAVPGTLGEALALSAEVLIAWGCYHGLGHGSRRLGDPRLATLFLILVPMLTAGTFALLRAVPAWALDDGDTSFLRWVSTFWLSHALGILTVAPLLLVTLTPWLVRHRFARPEAPELAPDAEEPRRLSRAGLVEIAILALLLTVLSASQTLVTAHHREIANWQLWGLPLLVIVWASLRYGPRGGTVMASSAVGAPLLILGLLQPAADPSPFKEIDALDPILQANLLAQCGAALLAAASADWIRLSEARYRLVVTRIPVILYSARAVPGPDDDGAMSPAEVTFVSPAARSLLGVEPDTLLGDYARWLALVHPDDRKGILAALARIGREDRPITCEFRLALAPERWLRDTLAPQYGPSRDLVGWDGVVSDITEQRALADELQRAQRLELIGRLASGIAHDFNNLLTVVLTLAELARLNLPEDHPVRDDLRRIAYAGEQAANLAHQLLAFSKQRRPAPKRIDVNRVAERTLELLRATLPKAIHIEPSLAKVELPVQADEMQLQQVLMNLCLNARDAMPNGGRLEVGTVVIPGNGRGPGDWVRLSVQDNGEGIPEDLQARIFDAFFSTKEHGTGLGLAMVRQIVEGFGGRVEVSSRPGEGARFDVWLPRETDGQTGQASGSSGTGLRSGEERSMPT